MIPSVETFLPFIIEVILCIQTIEQNISVKAELIGPKYRLLSVLIVYHSILIPLFVLILYDRLHDFSYLGRVFEVEPGLSNGKRVLLKDIDVICNVFSTF